MSEVRGFGSVAKRVYLVIKRRPDPPLTTHRQNTASTSARTTFTSTRRASGSIQRISSQQTTPIAQNKPVRELQCSALTSSYNTHCLQANISTIAHCTLFRWAAHFELVEGSSPLASVRLTSRALSLIDTNEAKARLDMEARASVNTSWSRGRAGNEHYTYNVNPSCCLYELHLSLSDAYGSETRCGFVNRNLLQTSPRYTLTRYPYAQLNYYTTVGVTLISTLLVCTNNPL